MFNTPEAQADGDMGPTEGSSLLPYVAQKEHQETMWVLQEKGLVNVHTPAVGLVILLLTANILLFSKICLFLFKAWILLRMLKKKKKAFSSPCIVHVRKKLYLGQRRLQNPKIGIPKEGHVLLWKGKSQSLPLHSRSIYRERRPRARLPAPLIAGDRGPG